MKVVVPKESGKILLSTYGSVLIGVVPMFETAVREMPKVANSMPITSMVMRRQRWEKRPEVFLS